MLADELVKLPICEELDSGDERLPFDLHGEQPIVSTESIDSRPCTAFSGSAELCESLIGGHTFVLDESGPGICGAHSLLLSGLRRQWEVVEVSAINRRTEPCSCLIRGRTCLA